MPNMDRLSLAANRFEGLALRGDRVIVREPSDARASVAVVCTFESAETARKFLELCEALPELLAAGRMAEPKGEA
jgi:hypothetical protein